MAADSTDDKAIEREPAQAADLHEPSLVRDLFDKTWAKIALAGVAVLLIGGGIVWWLIARQYVSTDDAFIAAHITYIAPQIAGTVAKIDVTDNEKVHAGQVLLEIDPAPARAKYQQAQAQQQQERTALAGAKAQLASASARAVQASQNLRRYRALHRHDPAAVTPQQMDQFIAAERSAVAERAAAAQQVAGARAQLAVATAQLHSARLNLGYTQIVAPRAGYVTQRTVATGNYVSPGEALMAIVPLQVWVTANFKETELDGMKPGDPATVSIDACGGATVKGHVASIQRGAGQAFGILPPENATGNFVKVVQRVPVRILLDSLPKHCVLGPGMSVEPSVKVR